MSTQDAVAVALDATGNTLDAGPGDQTFDYSDANRLRRTYDDAVLQATYSYASNGRRIKKVAATGAQQKSVFHYGVTGELIGESVYDAQGTLALVREYLWLASLPLAEVERHYHAQGTVTASHLVYVHADQLDTPRAATNGSGMVVWRWDSDAFGSGAADTDPDADTVEVDVPLRFPGQYFDQETGLHYNYFRDHDPSTGRYIESDPIGLAGGLNTYGYAYQNPITNFDPDGRFVWFGIPAIYWAAGAAGTAGLACIVTNCGQKPVDALSAPYYESRGRSDPLHFQS